MAQVYDEEDDAAYAAALDDFEASLPVGECHSQQNRGWASCPQSCPALLLSQLRRS